MRGGNCISSRVIHLSEKMGIVMGKITLCFEVVNNGGVGGVAGYMMGALGGIRWIWSH
jgi:hypothetical protein